DDPDNPEWTEEMFRKARPMREVDPDFVAAIEEMRKRGRPKLAHPKVQITLRLDEEVVNSFKEDGPGWQGRINAELKKTVRRRKKK
ncbi:MAG TPA: BrnA antitoxin family protein, partial [Rhizomicrobium sp.]|nr:BrnA antitoxin family protein [Rhizomicrobium sp.]